MEKTFCVMENRTSKIVADSVRDTYAHIRKVMSYAGWKTVRQVPVGNGVVELYVEKYKGV